MGAGTGCSISQTKALFFPTRMFFFFIVSLLYFCFVGVLSTAESLDHESKGLYILDVVAHIKGTNPPLSSPSQVVVMVTDENDNTPSFDQEEYTVSTIL